MSNLFSGDYFNFFCTNCNSEQGIHKNLLIGEDTYYHVCDDCDLENVITMEYNEDDEITDINVE